VVILNGGHFERFALFGLQALEGRAIPGDGANLDDRSEVEHRAFLGDRDGMVKTVGGDEEIAADGFLRFGEGTVGDGAAIFAGNDAGLVSERLAFLERAFRAQAFEPGEKAGEHTLNFSGGQGAVPAGAAEQEKVFGGGVGRIHRFVWLNCCVSKTRRMNGSRQDRRARFF